MAATEFGIRPRWLAFGHGLVLGAYQLEASMGKTSDSPCSEKVPLPKLDLS